MSNATKNFNIFNIFVISLSVLHYYFDGLTISFLDLYLTKFLNTQQNSILSVYDALFIFAKQKFQISKMIP